MGTPILALAVAEPTQRSVLEEALRLEGYEVTGHGAASSLFVAARTTALQATLLDVHLPEWEDGSLLRWVQTLHPRTPVLLLGGPETRRPWMAPVWSRPSTYTAPISPERDLLLALQRALDAAALERRVRSLERAGGPVDWGGLVGRSRALRRLVDELEGVAASETTIVIRGEPGVGKERVARALHAESGRRDGPFVPVHGPELRERWAPRLFGDEARGPGGPGGDRPGAVESASPGTLFLRGWDALLPVARGAVLEASRAQRVTRVGGGDARPVDFRLIVARPARAGEIPDGPGPPVPGVEVRVPPLRERLDDIPILVEHFVAREAPGPGLPDTSPEAMDRLLAYPWPGNVKELRAAVRRALATCGSVIGPEDLPERIRWGAESGPDVRGAGGSLPPDTLDLRALERWAIRRAVASCQGNLSEAALRLGIGRTTLYRKLDSYGLR